MNKIQKLLRAFNSEIFYKILKISELTDEETIIIRNFLLRKIRRDDICKQLHISRSTFQNIKQRALAKIERSLNFSLDKMITQ